MTGFFDASAALTIDVPYTPQQYYDALTSRDIIVNNQMKGSTGPMMEGFYYSAQTHFLQLPNIDWATYPTNPTTLNSADEAYWARAYGRFRRKLSVEQRGAKESHTELEFD